MTDPIARLREALADATAGPWGECGDDAISSLPSPGWAVASVRSYNNGTPRRREDKATRALIIAAINALPALLDVASAMQEIADTCAFHSGAGYKGIHEVATRALKRLAERGET